MMLSVLSALVIVYFIFKLYRFKRMTIIPITVFIILFVRLSGIILYLYIIHITVYKETEILLKTIKVRRYFDVLTYLHLDILLLYDQHIFMKRKK